MEIEHFASLGDKIFTETNRPSPHLGTDSPSKHLVRLFSLISVRITKSIVKVKNVAKSII